MGITAKTGAMKRGDWAMEMTVHLVIRAVIVPIIYAMVFWKFFLVLQLLKVSCPEKVDTKKAVFIILF